MIIRTEKTKRYTTLSNVAADDTGLSFKARGLFFYLMTKPDDWEITVQGIVAQSDKDKKDSVSTGLAELESKGYLTRKKVRNTDGTFKYEATLHEEPSRAENPALDNPIPENPPQVNTIEVITNTTTNVVGAEHEEARGREDINNVIDTFQQTFDLKLNRMPKQRIAASNLIRRYGLINVLGAVRAAGIVRDEQFSPQILSLEDLWSKWDKLAAYYRKKKSQETTGVTVITEE